MRHRKGNKKLGKPTDQRLALLKSLVVNLIKYKSIKTTDTRAKEAKKMAEKLITWGKKGDLHSRRLAIALLPNKETVTDIFKNIAKDYENRLGGYTRITKIGFRKGDGAKLAKLELVE